ncbi:MAG: AbrB family transcriptional regulator [Verrucomicrobia bacterium]|nr:MAG: AbrB family transcriptional regulator [Verrucomicrobiota bacterium]
MIATVTSKGQLTLPIEARRKFGIRAGSKLDFIFVGDDRMEVIPMTDSIKNLKGMVPPPAKPLTLEEMDAAIAGGSTS